jgi:DNA-3-methyladenine glycosylase II
MDTVDFILPVILPFRLDLTVWALRRRQKNTIDQWDGYQYTRVIVFDNRPVKMTITQSRAADKLQLHIVLQSQTALSIDVQEHAKFLVQNMLGLNINLQPFYLLAENDDVLNPLATQFMGVKPPRFLSVFEALINSIACQQVSLDVGVLVLNRLAENFGLKFADSGTTLYTFPRPEDLLDVSEEDIKKLGYSYQKARFIKGLAYGVVSGDIDLEHLEIAGNEQASSYLSAIHGIGRWSAEYTLLRGLGRLDILPGDDVGAQKNLQQLLTLEERPNYDQIRELTKIWDPYEGLIYFHMLLEKLHVKGLV